jgi:chromosome partitioning protein
MRITAISNQNGGTGKTSTAVNLSVALAKANKKVLVIDLDPQASLSYAFGIEDNNAIGLLLEKKKDLQAVIVEKEGVSIIPSSIELADLEVSLVNKIGREGILKKSLSKVDSFDYVLIDTPPSLSILTINALNYADDVLIPLQMEILTLKGLWQLLDTIAEVKDVLNSKLEVRGVVANMYNTQRNLSKEVLKEIKENAKGIKVFNTYIRQCVKIAEAPSFAKSVLSYAPSSNGSIDYTNLAKEFLTERS